MPTRVETLLLWPAVVAVSQSDERVIQTDEVMNAREGAPMPVVAVFARGHVERSAAHSLRFFSTEETALVDEPGTK